MTQANVSEAISTDSVRDTHAGHGGFSAATEGTFKGRVAMGLLTAFSVGALASTAQPTPAESATANLHEEPMPEVQADSRDMLKELRDAQRRLATSRLAPRRDTLYAEAAQLKGDMLAGTTAQDAARRLEYIRWQLHMIEDAEVGPSLDALERLAEINERLAATIRAIGRRVAGTPRTGRRGRHG